MPDADGEESPDQAQHHRDGPEPQPPPPPAGVVVMLLLLRFLRHTELFDLTATTSNEGASTIRLPESRYRV